MEALPRHSTTTFSSSVLTKPSASLALFLAPSRPMSPLKSETHDILHSEYHHSMLVSHQKVNLKEVIVGWYSTGLGVTGGSALIHEFYSSKVSKPVHLTVDTGFKNGQGAIKAYVSFNLPLGDQQLAAQFQEITLDLRMVEAEQIGFDILKTTVILSLSPAELLLGKPLSKQTEKSLRAYSGPSLNVPVEHASREYFKDGRASDKRYAWYGASAKVVAGVFGTKIDFRVGNLWYLYMLLIGGLTPYKCTYEFSMPINVLEWMSLFCA